MTQKGAGQTWIGCLLLRVGTRQESEDAYKTFLRCTLAAGLAAAVEGRALRANVKCQLGVIRAARGQPGSRRGSRAAGNLLIQYGARVERPAPNGAPRRTRGARGATGQPGVWIRHRAVPRRVSHDHRAAPPLFFPGARALPDLPRRPQSGPGRRPAVQREARLPRQVSQGGRDAKSEPHVPNLPGGVHTHAPLRHGQRREARPESPPLGPLDLAASPLLRALADADRFGGRVVGEEVEAATRENMSVCAGSFLV